MCLNSAFRGQWLPGDVTTVWHHLYPTHSSADAEQENSSQAAHNTGGRSLRPQGTRLLSARLLDLHSNTELQLFVRDLNDYLIVLQVRVVILADRPLEDVFILDGDHGHDESHILMDDLGLKRVRAPTVFPAKPVFHVGCVLQVVKRWLLSWLRLSAVGDSSLKHTSDSVLHFCSSLHVRQYITDWSTAINPLDLILDWINSCVDTWVALYL